MARIRSIKPQFFKNEDLADLSFEARLCFIGLWGQADREGRLEDRPRRLKAELFPYDDAVDIDDLLARLCGGGFIVRYAVSGEPYIAIPTFKKHQRPKADELPSEIPEQISVPRGKVTTPRGKVMPPRGKVMPPRISDMSPRISSTAPRIGEGGGGRKGGEEAEAGKEAEAVRPAAVAKPPQAAIAVAGADARSKRPMFKGTRFVVFEWQLDDLRRLLGSHAEAFDLHAWFFELNAKADAAEIVVPQRDGGKWLQEQTQEEAVRRGLPVATAATSQGKTAGNVSAMRRFIAGGKA